MKKALRGNVVFPVANAEQLRSIILFFSESDLYFSISISEERRLNLILGSQRPEELDC